MSKSHPAKFDPTKKVFGWVPGHPEESRRVAASLRYPTYSHLPPNAKQFLGQQDAFLWLAKNKIQPGWHRGQQGIGDCVSWGAEFACTCLLWQQALLGDSPWLAEACTETIYGGCRVEVHGGRSPMNKDEDGAIGAWAIKWLLDYGVLLRIDYSGQTGDPLHDLRVYSAKKAEEMGARGCGGRADKDALDNLAKAHPCKEGTLCRTTNDVVNALQRGCPVTTASMAGYGDMRRNADGIVNPSDQWPHQTCFGGLRWFNGKPNFRLFQSWDDMDCSGPDPGADDDDVSDCSWWITEQALQQHLRDEDTFALSRVEGFDLPPFNLSTGLLV